MPTTPLNRTNAWNAWMNARVCGVNAFLDIVKPDESVDYYDRTVPGNVTRTLAHRTLNNLANRQGYNAIRLWITGSGDLANMALVASTGWSVNKSTVSIVEGSGTPTTITTIHQWRDRIKSILKACESLGMGVIFVGSTTGLICTYEAVDPSPAPNKNTPTDNNHKVVIDFWRETVKEFGNSPALIGIDPVNEPRAGSEEKFGNIPQGTYVSDLRTAKYGWPKLAQDIINAVRDQEKATGQAMPPIPMVICSPKGPAIYIKVFNAPAPDPKPEPGGSSPTYLKDPGLGYTFWNNYLTSSGASGWIVYQFHSYEPEGITHQGVNDWQTLGWTYPAGNLRQINRRWENDRWLDDSWCSMAEHWGNKVESFNNKDDILKQWAEAIALRDAAELNSNGKKQPMFLGEFSFVQPDLKNVYPSSSKRLDLTWEAASPNVLRMNVVDGIEQKKYYPVWTDAAWHPKSRQITEFDIFTHPTNNKTYIRAYFDNISRWSFGRLSFTDPIDIATPGEPPTPPTGTAAGAGKTTTDRSNNSSTKGIHGGDLAMGFDVATTRSLKSEFNDPNNPMSWDNKNFKHTVSMLITPSDPATARFAPLTKVNVTIEADKYWVEYEAPDQTVTAGIPRKKRGAPYYPPIAIASFFSATDSVDPSQEKDMEPSRARYVQDVLCAAQQSRFSWAYHAANALDGFIGWTPGYEMNNWLRQAAMGRRLPVRT